ncbi:helix-turn-helix transcriptional regulator [Oscillatoriales cyanobacterium LEGE 11467]|uniref:Helix-turn-helix transcriptional regulator n=1 Tax=Zarconia navalis LEGE 11467 TaxID=1828826 RepID=A0A928VY47_9CYAN|nr:AraC family transcriptional regulator [Zarconia navalis]MBE9042246.1 helix-turn-helix transcriptional regulator [Zarconia navalis LEGE 11467]
MERNARQKVSSDRDRSVPAARGEGKIRSNIQFFDRQTRSPRSDIDVGTVTASSQGLGWKGIHIESGQNDGFRTDDVIVPQHYFAMNVGSSFEWEWKDGNCFRKERSQPGTIWVNPAGVPFSHRVYGDNQFALLTLEPQQLLEGLPEEAAIDSEAFSREHHARDPQIQHLMNALLQEASARNPNGKLYVELLSTALSIHYVNHYRLAGPLDRQIDFSRVKAGDRHRIGKAIDYIEAFLSEDISLDDLATVAGRSKFHFCRLFKVAVGLTPHQYLMKRRVERAAQALTRGTPNIANVAIAYGFSDQTHFTRNFKKIKGITPGEFIKKKR